jgi:hypothetical protein
LRFSRRTEFSGGRISPIGQGRTDGRDRSKRVDIEGPQAEAERWKVPRRRTVGSGRSGGHRPTHRPKAWIESGNQREPSAVAPSSDSES